MADKSQTKGFARLNLIVSATAIVLATSAIFLVYGTHSASQEHANAVSHFAQHSAALAASAEPVHPVVLDGVKRFRCVTSTGWAYDATTQRDADQLCSKATADSKKAGSGISITDPAMLKQGMAEKL